MTFVFAVNRWLGVNGASSSGDVEIVVRGLELTIASTSHIKVRNVSSLSLVPNSRVSCERTLRTVLIWRSQIPPI